MSHHNQFDYPIFAKLAAVGCDMRETKPGEWTGICPVRPCDTHTLVVKIDAANKATICCAVNGDGNACDFREIMESVGAIGSDLYRKSNIVVSATSARLPRPFCEPPLLGEIPTAMKNEQRWCWWGYFWKKKEKAWAKVPIDKDGNWMKWSNRENWLTFNEVAKARRGDGVGFFLGDGWAGCDLDDHLDPTTKEADAFAKKILSRLNSRSEISPSGKGVKTIVRANIKDALTPDEAGIEIYGHGRFFTVTGRRINDYPADVEDRHEELTALLNECLFQRGKKTKTKKTVTPDTGSTDRETALAALAALSDVRLEGYGDWLKIGMALHAVDPSLLMLSTWDSRSRSSSKYADGACVEKWSSFNGDGGGVGVGSLCHWADQDSPGWRAQYRANGATHKQTTPNEAPDDPHRLARLFIDQRGTSSTGELTLRYWCDEWWLWDGFAYRTISPAELRADLAAIIKREFDDLKVNELAKPREAEEPSPTVKKVTTGLLTNVTLALSSLSILSSRILQPSWLTHEDEPFPANEVFATRTGLIHIPSLIAGTPSTLQPTPQFFSAGAVDYGFVSDAECPEWLRFLKSLWPDDPQSIASLQEWFGYLLLPDTRQHKILLLIGPPRSGKGAIGRILKRLIGERSFATPTLSSLASPFGLWPLFGKSVALIPDARLSGRADAIATTERLLSISGEDPQDIHRKCLPTITGVKLPVRFVLMTIELPNLQDSSGAFSNRVVMLRTTQSWLGKEDKHLDARLQSELSGILNWSINGWQRLQERGRFRQPDSALELLADLSDLTSPISMFLRERCKIEIGEEASVEELFEAWLNWCAEHGRNKPGTQQAFGRDLHAKVTTLTIKQPRIEGSRIRIYEGISVLAGTHWHARQSYERATSKNELEGEDTHDTE